MERMITLFLLMIMSAMEMMMPLFIWLAQALFTVLLFILQLVVQAVATLFGFLFSAIQSNPKVAGIIFAVTAVAGLLIVGVTYITGM
ncbi:hypothetical protein EYB53_001825 [Candidatus Chloroploca sp. M-50]|uniref:Uncharacterized protein n=1 Tax=Candidatus Chloroploca mongolica TaxID=2528176 RepID=A0ABS4D4S9_9CHLR|nr:hypothetical protein [Candidatus Chloroploca mongolica]MBP1464436.1 hypothetical protein [Candidatus Chloroploca mongolica]